MIRQLEQLKKDRIKNGLNSNINNITNSFKSNMFTDNTSTSATARLINQFGINNNSISSSPQDQPQNCSSPNDLSNNANRVLSSSHRDSRTHPHLNSENCGNIQSNPGDINTFDCIALHINPDLGERIMLSGERQVLDEVFPETTQAILDARSGVTATWNQHDARHVIRFPLNGYCKMNSVQTITRLFNCGFHIVASNGGGVEGQQFSEYLFVRKVYNYSK